MADRFWVNDDADGLLNNADNWASSSGGAGGAGIPTTGDDVYFDDQCTDNCVDTDAGSEVLYGNLMMSSGYTGTTTWTRNPYWIDVDLSDGICQCTANAFNVKGDLYVRDGGTFTLTSGSTSKIYGDITVYNGGVFTFPSCVILWRPTTNNNTLTCTVQSGGTLSGLTFSLAKQSYHISGVIDASFTLGVALSGNDFYLDGDSTIHDLTSSSDADWDFDLKDFDLTITGDLTFTLGTWTKGTGSLIFSGTEAQTVNLNDETVEDIEIDKTAEIVTLTGGFTTDSLTLTDGTLDIDGNNIETTGNFTQAADTTCQDTTGGGLITVGGNFVINGSSGNECIWNGPDLDVTGTAVAHYTTATDSDATAGTEVTATDNCVDGTGNTDWDFGAAGISMPIVMQQMDQFNGGAIL